jgi:hypothetical protein
METITMAEVANVFSRREGVGYIGSLLLLRRKVGMFDARR